jgi:nucleotide-binding universal stress UspA family protein
VAANTIVVGYDHSEPAQAALRWATEQAECSSSELLLVYAASTVVDWELAALQFDPDPLRRRIEHSLENEWTEPLRTRGITYSTKFVLGRPAEQLMNVARACDAQLIVIGMSPRGTLTELISGSTLHDLRKHAVRPVVVVPPGWTASMAPTP